MAQPIRQTKADARSTKTVEHEEEKKSVGQSELATS
jgi:hypothetical protein